MSTTLITNISEAFLSDAAHTLIENAAILIDGEDIAWVGEAEHAPEADSVIDAGQRAAL